MQFYSGEIRTIEPFRYGKFVARMQGSNQKGTTASFFTFWNGNDDEMSMTLEEWNEISIELMPSSEAYPFCTKLIYDYMN